MATETLIAEMFKADLALRQIDERIAKLELDIADYHSKNKAQHLREERAGELRDLENALGAAMVDRIGGRNPITGEHVNGGALAECERCRKAIAEHENAERGE